jgi:hypothetical protein
MGNIISPCLFEQHQWETTHISKRVCGESLPTAVLLGMPTAEWFGSSRVIRVYIQGRCKNCNELSMWEQKGWGRHVEISASPKRTQTSFEEVATYSKEGMWIEVTPDPDPLKDV